MSSLVSIICPSYNSSLYISKTIESVISQSYSNWELLIVDDGSTDMSYDVIMKYAQIDKRIICFKFNENRGVAHARNFALEKANGRYIAFIDSDDLWLNFKLDLQISFIQEHGIPFTYSSYFVINDSSDVIAKFIPNPKLNYFNLLKTCSIGTLTVVYDSFKLGKHAMLPFSKGQDYCLWLKIHKQIKESYGLIQPLALYRRHINSTTANRIKSAYYQWMTYRCVEKLSIIKSLYYFMFYTYHGFFKYRKMSRKSLKQT